MGGIGVLLNPRAGATPASTRRLRERLNEALDGRFTLEVTWSISEIPAAVDRMMEEGVEILCVCGGDGTLHHLLGHLIPRAKGGRLPLILPIPTGTMNNAARTLGLSGRPEEVLKRAAAYRDSRLNIVRINTLKINERYGFIFSAGFPVGLLEAYYSGVGRGRGKALLVVLKAIYSSAVRSDFFKETFDYLDCSLTLDGERASFPRFNAVLCGTIGSLGCGLNPAYRWRERGDRFHALVSSVSPQRMLFKLPHVMLGIPLGGGVWDVLGRRMVIEGGSPLKYLFDGEIYCEGSQVTVELGPSVQMIKV